MTWAIGIDTGGTFTDVIAMETNTGEIHTLKVPSTPADPSQALLNGVEAFLQAVPGATASDISFFAHGTTVATNAVIERKGVPTGLLITRGTGAVYMARMSRQPAPFEMLNPNFQKPAPLVANRFTREIPERVLFYGSVELVLDEAAVLAAVTELVEVHGIQSLAVSYLFSFMRPLHEQRTKEPSTRCCRTAISCRAFHSDASEPKARRAAVHRSSPDRSRPGARQRTCTAGPRPGRHESGRCHPPGAEWRGRIGQSVATGHTKAAG
jgi:N-methylhydantoinase A